VFNTGAACVSFVYHQSTIGENISDKASMVLGVSFGFQHQFTLINKSVARILFGRSRARAKMIVKGGVCTPGCDERGFVMSVTSEALL
jgi:hypothetical protein